MLCSHDLRRMLIAFAHSINIAFRASFMREFVTNLKEGAVNASLGPWSQLSVYMCIGSGLESFSYAECLGVSQIGTQTLCLRCKIEATHRVEYRAPG